MNNKYKMQIHFGVTLSDPMRQMAMIAIPDGWVPMKTRIEYYKLMQVILCKPIYKADIVDLFPQGE